MHVRPANPKTAPSLKLRDQMHAIESTTGYFAHVKCDADDNGELVSNPIAASIDLVPDVLMVLFPEPIGRFDCDRRGRLRKSPRAKSKSSGQCGNFIQPGD